MALDVAIKKGNKDFLANGGQRRGQVDGRGGLADPAFLIRNRNDPRLAVVVL